MEKAENGDEIYVGVFAGEPKYCQKLDVVVQTLTYLQTYNRGIDIEPFLVPIPKDAEQFAVMRRQAINSVEKLFENYSKRH